MKYVVMVRGRRFEVAVEEGAVVVDGTRLPATLEAVDGVPMRIVRLGERVLAVPVEELGGGRWGLTARGERVEVEVLDERTSFLRALATREGAGGAGARLTAPMPGLVVRVAAEPGQEVAAGAGLVVLEAMKMENELKSPGAGRVKAVLVSPGQAVDKGQLLIELEPAGQG